MNYTEIKLNNTDTGFIYNNKPIFKEFKRAMSFHKEGLAAVYDETGAFHINTDGEAIYNQRYIETFGYYDNIATVRDNIGYFHIDCNGKEINSQKYIWSGNFQEERCVVQTINGFNHINTKGKIISTEYFKYCGDFRYGIAVVHSFEGKAFHIDLDGNRINDKSFIDADVYHKGFAVVADKQGYFHVDKKGNAIYTYRFKKAEVFYNGWAYCEDFEGNKVRINENGEKLFLKNDNKIFGLADIVELVNNDYKVGLFFRHSERFIDNQVLTGSEVQLTENGKKMSLRFGESIKAIKEINSFSSPIYRCVNTLELIQKGASSNNEIIETKMLGAPGCFVDPERESSCGDAMAKQGFMNYTLSYNQNFNNIGSRNLIEASIEIEDFITKNMKKGLTLFNTHDFFVSAFMRYTGVKNTTADDYVAYLEGVIIAEKDGKKTFSRFLFEG